VIELYRLCICSFLCPMIFMAVIVSTQTCLNLLTVKCRRSYNRWSTIPALRQAPQRPSEGAPTVSRYTGTLVECLSVVLYAPQRMCRTPSPCLALSLMVSLHRMSLITRLLPIPISHEEEPTMKNTLRRIQKGTKQASG